MTGVFSSGSLDIYPTFFMSEDSFVEKEQQRYNSNPYRVARIVDDLIPDESLIGINLSLVLKKSQWILSEKMVFIARLIHDLYRSNDEK